jgi:hypothetical protein
MKRKIFITIVFLIILSFGFLCWMIYHQENAYETRGELLIKQIETFREIEKKLPKNLNDLGVVEPMNEGPYYEKVDSINYKVYVFIGFDNSLVYYSKLKEWKNEQ